MRLRHADSHIMFVDKVESKYNTADLGTKAIKPIELFEFLRDRMTGYDPEFYTTPRIREALRQVLFVAEMQDCLLIQAESKGGLLEYGTNSTKKGALNFHSETIDPSSHEAPPCRFTYAGTC